MKIFFPFLAFTLISCAAASKETVYQGSTPAHQDVREFLGISLTDSIDFIRWKMVLYTDHYEVDCRYGISRPSTNGFMDETKVSFSGQLSKQGVYYRLQQGNRTLNAMAINANLLHLLDQHKALLIGNGGYSYALNSVTPVKSDQVNPSFQQTPIRHYAAYQGRTPCQGLSSSPTCEKVKWYIILFVDSITGKPSYYLQGGRQYRKESMTRGHWEISQRQDGRIIYKLNPEKGARAIHLLKADDNILFFTDPEGNLLVGNENFSYTLNRTTDREPADVAGH